MDLSGGLAPRHRLSLSLPKGWPSCAQGLLRNGASLLHQGGSGGWGGDLLALPGGPELEARWDGQRFRSPASDSPWEALQSLTAASPHPWIGAASFELACAEADLPFQAPPPGSLGMRWTGMTSALFVHAEGAEFWSWTEEKPGTAAIEAQLGQSCALGRNASLAVCPAWAEAEHRGAVDRIQEAIRDGGFYVANLCVPFRAAFAGDALTFGLARFRKARPPFGAYLSLPGVTLISLSMERLLAKEGRRIWTEPIKGSAPLRGDPEADAAEGLRLAKDPKERAEHTMIVDLLRNDLGRVAEAGSVRVASLMEGRAFPTVQHLVSRLEATLKPDLGLADLLRSVLPGGSVTGAPKRAVCAHLASSEAGPRGFYCGALGWIGPGGRCLDLALPIRTAQLTEAELTYWAGGGITRRSDSAKEWEELLLKTRVLEH